MIPADRSHLHVAVGTHPGMSGKNNEDRYAVSAYRISEDTSDSALFAIVSDGIGGHRAGEIAAEIAVETISQDIAASEASDPLPTLSAAISHASQEILAQAEKDSEKHGMGATCACCWVIKNRLYITYVGDSRIYLLRGGTIRQLTIDHTWIQEALQAGILTPEQAVGHPNAHVIRRHLGSRQPVEPDARLFLQPGESNEQAIANQGMYLQPEDQLLLCSDGLTDLVNNDEISATLKNEALKNDQKKIDALIHQANQRGGHDNITIVTLRMPVNASPNESLPVTTRLRQTDLNLKWGCAAGIALVAILGLLLAGFFLFARFPIFASQPSATPTRQLNTLPTVALTPQLFSPSGTPRPSPTLPVAPPTATPTPTSGPTITAWPTNTLAP